MRVFGERKEKEFPGLNPTQKLKMLDIVSLM